MPHNIERSAFRAGEYVGYGQGFVWRIRRWTGGWRAMTPSGTYRWGRTLDELSTKIGDKTMSGPLRWNETRKHAVLDVDDLGRVLIKRRVPRGLWAAYLNGELMTEIKPDGNRLLVKTRAERHVVALFNKIGAAS